MSATNRGAKRRESDYYPTPSWCTQRFFECIQRFWDSTTVRRWVEPCAGDGAIVRASGLAWSRWITGDTEPRHDLILERDFADTIRAGSSGYRSGQFAIVTNPPFGIADDIVRESLRRTHRAAFLLRLNWLAGAKRSKWLRENPPDCVMALPERPSFTGDGRTDATDYAWFVWDWSWDGDGVIILENTPIEERRRG